MPHVPGLRSCYDTVERLVYLGRLCDKIRLHAAGRLPADYQPNLGKGFDARACAFLRVGYGALRDRVLAGATDEAVVAWAWDTGGRRTDEECEVWNFFMLKRGWRDATTPTLRQRIVEYGLAGRPIETWFDLNDCDEGRDPIAARRWERL
jgi:gluconokinase